MTIPPDVESLIEDASVSAHLATSVDDRPHVAPVWYGYRDGVLYFMTGGRKLENVRRNPRVALSIEGEDVAWNVTLLGRASVTTDPDRLEWANGWIYDKYDDDGATDDPDSEAEIQPDGGDDARYALVEVRPASAAWNVY